MSRYVANQADYWGNIRGRMRYICVKMPRNHACLLSLFPSLFIYGFLTFGEPKITGSIQPVCIKTYVFRVYYRRRVEWPREHLEEERFTTCFDAFLIRKQIPHAIRYNVTVRLIRFPIASLFLFRLSMRIHSRVKVFSSCLVLSLSLSLTRLRIH